MNILNNKKTIYIYKIIMVLFSYVTICLYGSLKPYDIVSWLLFFCLIIIFIKCNIINKNLKKEIIGLSLLFSIITIFGGIAYSLQKNNYLSIFSEFFSLKNMFFVVGLFNIFFVLLTYTIPKLYQYSFKANKKLINSRNLFFICLIIILLAWLPYFLNFYPGALTPDSLSELRTILNDFNIVSDHHPVIHIMFIFITYNIGYELFGTMSASIAFSTIIQMIIMASIFSYSIVFLNKRKLNKLFLSIVLGFYALLPVHGYYSIVMWKDVIFSGSLLLLSMQCITILEKYKSNQLCFKNLIGFIFVSLLCVFFRNNAIYMYFLFAFLTLIIFKKYYKSFLLVFLIVFGTYFFVKGPIFDLFHVTKSASVEYIGIPLQQIGRMTFKNVSFTEEEKKLINDLMPIEKMSVAYNPQVSDGIKFNENFNSKAFDDNKLEYLKLWINLVFKHPSIALEAYTISTLGYWYPGVEYWSVANHIWENEYGLQTDSKLPIIFDKLIKKIERRDTPILNIEWSIGLCFWVIFIFIIISFKLNGIKGIYPFVPVFGIWLTMMIASPVYSEYRYVYGAFTSLPILMLSPYIIKNIKLKK